MSVTREASRALTYRSLLLLLFVIGQPSLDLIRLQIIARKVG
jgi:hypothetical protein